MRRLAQHLYLGLHRLKKSARFLFSLENLVLLLLSASFGYSLLSLMVHIVDREGESETLAQISPNGSSLLQVRQTGLAVFDVESGKLIDELRLIGRWRNAFLPHEKRTDLWTRGDRFALPFNKTENLQISSKAQVVVVRCLDDTLLWWNRATGQHRKVDSPRFWWSEIALDEARDRFFVTTLRGYKAGVEGPPTLEESSGRYEPHSFNAIGYIHVFRLSTGAELCKVRSCEMGQPVLGQSDYRVREKEGQIELLHWPTFPEGNPQVHRTFSLPAEYLNSIKSSVPPIIRYGDETLVFEDFTSLHRLLSQEDTGGKKNQVRTIRLGANGVSTSIRQLYSDMTHLEILDPISGYAASDFYDQVHEKPIWQLEIVSGAYRAKMTRPIGSDSEDLRADFALSAAKLQGSKIRLARDDGAIFDIDFNAPDKTTAWKIPLLPHRQIPRDAIAAFLAGALLWLAYAYKTKCLFAKQGWVVLISLFAWPLLLAGLEQGFALELPATLRQATLTQVTVTQVAIVAIASIPLLACTLGLFLAAGRSRAIALAPWFLLVILSAGAIESVAYRESATFLEHFGIRLSWRNE